MHSTSQFHKTSLSKCVSLGSPLFWTWWGWPKTIPAKPPCNWLVLQLLLFLRRNWHQETCACVCLLFLLSSTLRVYLHVVCLKSFRWFQIVLDALGPLAWTLKLIEACWSLLVLHLVLHLMLHLVPHLVPHVVPHVVCGSYDLSRWSAWKRWSTACARSWQCFVRSNYMEPLFNHCSTMFNQNLEPQFNIVQPLPEFWTKLRKNWTCWAKGSNAWCNT